MVVLVVVVVVVVLLLLLLLLLLLAMLLLLLLWVVVFIYLVPDTFYGFLVFHLISILSSVVTSKTGFLLPF